MNDLTPFKPTGQDLAPLEVLDEDSKDFKRSSRAAATRKAYADDWLNFSTWCEARGIVPLPASAKIVANYLSSLAKAGKSCSTVGRRLAAIRFVHRGAGAPIPKSDELTAIISGIRRAIGVSPRNKKSAATADLIQGALDGIRGNGAKATRDRALLVLGFAAALRRSELVALDVEDITFCPEGLRIQIRRSKTDQAGEGAEIAVPLGKKLFPARLLKDWIELAGITTGAIFRPIRRGGTICQERIAGSAVARIVKQRMHAVGIDPAAFSGHSLRAGFVTSACANNANLFRIADVTRHKSLGILRGYDRQAQAFTNAPGDSFL